nr:unnamed protein product [Callosobruchus analis]
MENVSPVVVTLPLLNYNYFGVIQVFTYKLLCRGAGNVLCVIENEGYTNQSSALGVITGHRKICEEERKRIKT